ncbi:MAG: hypothetical protein Q9168_008118, partial [Polycauliona sp. 1 TL-2023]
MAKETVFEGTGTPRTDNELYYISDEVDPPLAEATTLPSLLPKHFGFTTCFSTPSPLCSASAYLLDHPARHILYRLFLDIPIHEYTYPLCHNHLQPRPTIITPNKMLAEPITALFSAATVALIYLIFNSFQKEIAVLFNKPIPGVPKDFNGTRPGKDFHNGFGDAVQDWLNGTEMEYVLLEFDPLPLPSSYDKAVLSAVLPTGGGEVLVTATTTTGLEGMFTAAGSGREEFSVVVATSSAVLVPLTTSILLPLPTPTSTGSETPSPTSSISTTVPSLSSTSTALPPSTPASTTEALPPPTPDPINTIPH